MAYDKSIAREIQAAIDCNYSTALQAARQRLERYRVTGLDLKASVTAIREEIETEKWDLFGLRPGAGIGHHRLVSRIAKELGHNRDDIDAAVERRRSQLAAEGHSKRVVSQLLYDAYAEENWAFFQLSRQD